MKEISLNTRKIKGNIGKSYIALVDDEDYEWLNQWNWTATVRFGLVHALRTEYTKISDIPKAIYSTKVIWMHRLILGVSDIKIKVDHKDRNGLNNQRGNLRPATVSQNAMNKKSKVGGLSKYLGVTYDKAIRKHILKDGTETYYIGKGGWRASIRINGKNKYLGIFSVEEDAGKAYDTAARIHHGEFANLNFKEELNLQEC